jgi:hypothetical protein
MLLRLQPLNGRAGHIYEARVSKWQTGRFKSLIPDQRPVCPFFTNYHPNQTSDENINCHQTRF